MTTTDIPPPMDIRPARKGLLRRLSLVWIVPVLVLIVTLGVAWQAYIDRGTVIEISFENASGISAETQIKYRDITVGVVEKVSFAEGLDIVVVRARVDKEIAPYLDDDAAFWVVRPDVSVRGISGLDTVLSGVYIQGNWDIEPETAQYYFTALERAPLTLAGQRGVQVLLRAPDGGSLTQGAPILHKGIKVGYLEQPELARNGQGVEVTAFIEEPYNRRITSRTRFWDTSGFSVNVGAGGLELNVDSIASLIEGGIAFDTVISGGTVVEDGDTFEIFDNEDTARESVFIDPNREILNVAVYFEDSVNGLAEGSPVRMGGIAVGQVSDISAIVRGIEGMQQVRLLATLAIDPQLFGMAAGTSADDTLDALENLVAQGLRARLVTGNILSGSLNVELLEVPGAPMQLLDKQGDPYPTIPTTAAAVADVAASAETLLDRLNKLPIEGVMNGAISLMASFEVLATDGDLRAAPEELLALLTDIRDIVGSDDIQAIPGEIDAVIANIDTLLTDAGTITTQIAQADLVTSLNDVLVSSNTAIINFDAATTGIGSIISEINDLSSKANALDVESLLAQTTDTLAAFDTLASGEATQAIAPSVLAAIDEIRVVVADVRDGGAVENLTSALASASAAADAVEQSVAGLPGLTTQAADVLTQLQAAADDLPAITSQIEALTAKANALEIEALATQASETLASMNTILSTNGAQQLPAALTSSLREVEGFLAEVRAGGAVENVNAALASASAAARTIQDAAAGLPALTTRAAQLVNTIDAVAGSYGERSRFNAETAATLRDIQAAADAVSSLARAIQRNPNSLLTGR